jgi:hypothetical protein
LLPARRVKQFARGHIEEQRRRGIKRECVRQRQRCLVVRVGHCRDELRRALDHPRGFLNRLNVRLRDAGAGQNIVELVNQQQPVQRLNLIAHGGGVVADRLCNSEPLQSAQSVSALRLLRLMVC